MSSTPIADTITQTPSFSDALQIVREHQAQRREAFRVELDALCQKYGVEISATVQITVTGI